MTIIAIVAAAFLAQQVPEATVGGTPASCGVGQITAMTYSGYRDDTSHDPNLRVTVNAKDVYIGMSANTDKSRMAFSDMRATLLSAMLSGSNVGILYNGSSCPVYPTEDQLKIVVTIPLPGAVSQVELPETE